MALALAVSLFGLSLSPDRYLLVLLAPAVALRRGRRFLLDFVPYVLLILLYAEARGVAHLLSPAPYYLPQLDLERWVFAGHVPTVDLQHALWTGTKRWYDTLSIDVTKVHSLVPPLLGFVLWVRRRALFYRFAASMLVLSFAAAVTFLLLPAAPPWAASSRGLLPEVTRLVGGPGSPARLGRFSISHFVDPNPYAAIPSLHGGYAFLCFLFVALLAWRTRWRWLALCGLAYPLLQSWAAVYTGNHYVVDLVIGFAYAAAAVLAVRWFWRRRGWPE